MSTDISARSGKTESTTHLPSGGYDEQRERCVAAMVAKIANDDALGDAISFDAWESFGGSITKTLIKSHLTGIVQSSDSATIESFKRNIGALIADAALKYMSESVELSE